MNCLQLFCMFLPLFMQPPIPFYRRVAFQGDSFTAGLYASSVSATWRAQLMGWLREANPDIQEDFVVTTGARMTSANAATQAARETVTNSPDLAMVALGINDAYGGVDDAAFEDAAQRVLDAYAGRRVMVVGTYWTGEQAGNSDYARAESLNGILERQALQHGYGFVDMWTLTQGHPEYLSSPDVASAFPPGYRGDGFHYGDVGHRAIYGILRYRVILH